MKLIIAQVFGIAAMASLFLIYQQKERKQLLLCKLSADICWVIYYVCHGAVGGTIPNLVGIFRESVFLCSSKKWANSKLWPAFFIVLNWTIAIWKWDEPFDFIPICASTFVTISLWVKSPRLTRIISAPVSAAFVVYNLLAGTWLGVINDSVGLVSVIISLVRPDLDRKNCGNRQQNIQGGEKITDMGKDT